MLDLVPLAVILIVPFIVWFDYRAKQAKAAARREVQLALLAKFNSGEELTRFLVTEEGKRLMDHLASPGQDDPRHKTAGMLIGGSIMTMLGISFVAATALTGNQFLWIPALVNMAIGIGLFAGAAIMHRFSKQVESTREQP